MDLMDKPKNRFYSIQTFSLAKRNKNGSSSVKIKAGIVDQTIIGPFKIDEGVWLDSANYCDFMDKTFFAWYKSKPRSFKVKCVFMHEDAPSQVSKLTCKRFTGNKIMGWPLSIHDLSPIKRLWSIVTIKLYEGGKQ